MTLSTLARELEERERTGRPLAVAVVGAGMMGKGLVEQLWRMPGLRPALVANRTRSRAAAAWGLVPRSGAPLSSDDPEALERAILERRPTITGDLELAASLEPIDVVMEATGNVEVGARVALAAIDARTHVASLNAELDATVGCLLQGIASQRGVVYSNADGDQPGVLVRQVEWARACGFEVRAAVNCKGYLDPEATPESMREWVRARGIPALSLGMVVGFTDGTKMNIENNVVANSTGLLPLRRGMSGVRTTLAEALEALAPLLAEGKPFVDYTLGGDFGRGVFVVGSRPAAPEGPPYLDYLGLGPGPDHLLHRAYHLCAVEAPLSAAEAALRGEPTIPLAPAPLAQTVAVAKRKLEPDRPLEGIGGRDVYGRLDSTERSSGLLPVGLADAATAIGPVAKGAAVALDSVELDGSRLAVRLWRRQLELNHDPLGLEHGALRPFARA